MTFIEHKRPKLLFKIITFFIIVAFTFNMVLLPAKNSYAQVMSLPEPGSMVSLTPQFAPAVIAGVKIDPKNPLSLDFVVSRGEDDAVGVNKPEEAQKLVKYFLAALTVPDKDQWVNLSPYEKDKIVSENFGQTEMGRDLLAQDYILKQLTASLIYPEDALGREFWDKIYEKVYEKYGSDTEVPVNTFNKVWIVPDKAVVFEKDNTAWVVQSSLKVMLAEDYIALNKNMDNSRFKLDEVTPAQAESLSATTSEIIKEIIIPAIEKEVNEGQNFAQLRQIYSSMILATWYKKNLKDSLLGKVYANKGKVSGIELDDKTQNEQIYQRYLDAFKVGVFDYVKEEFNPQTQQLTPKKYFSGGFDSSKLEEIQKTISPYSRVPRALKKAINTKYNKLTKEGLVNVNIKLLELGEPNWNPSALDKYEMYFTASEIQKMQPLMKAINQEFKAAGINASPEQTSDSVLAALWDLYSPEVTEVEIDGKQYSISDVSDNEKLLAKAVRQKAQIIQSRKDEIKAAKAKNAEAEKKRAQENAKAKAARIAATQATKDAREKIKQEKEAANKAVTDAESEIINLEEIVAEQPKISVAQESMATAEQKLDALKIAFQKAAAAVMSFNVTNTSAQWLQLEADSAKIDLDYKKAAFETAVETGNKDEIAAKQVEEESAQKNADTKQKTADEAKLKVSQAKEAAKQEIANLRETKKVAYASIKQALSQEPDIDKIILDVETQKGLVDDAEARVTALRAQKNAAIEKLRELRVNVSAAGQNLLASKNKRALRGYYMRRVNDHNKAYNEAFQLNHDLEVAKLNLGNQRNLLKKAQEQLLEKAGAEVTTQDTAVAEAESAAVSAVDELNTKEKNKTDADLAADQAYVNESDTIINLSDLEATQTAEDEAALENDSVLAVTAASEETKAGMWSIFYSKAASARTAVLASVVVGALSLAAVLGFQNYKFYQAMDAQRDNLTHVMKVQNEAAQKQLDQIKQNVAGKITNLEEVIKGVEARNAQLEKENSKMAALKAETVTLKEKLNNLGIVMNKKVENVSRTAYENRMKAQVKLKDISDRFRDLNDKVNSQGDLSNKEIADLFGQVASSKQDLDNLKTAFDKAEDRGVFEESAVRIGNTGRAGYETGKEGLGFLGGKLVKAKDATYEFVVEDGGVFLVDVKDGTKKYAGMAVDGSVKYTKGAATFLIGGVKYFYDGGKNVLIKIGDALTADDGARNGNFIDESGAITWYSYNINDAQTDPNTSKVYYIGTVNDKDGVKIYPSADGRTVTYDATTSVEQKTDNIDGGIVKYLGETYKGVVDGGSAFLVDVKDGTKKYAGMAIDGSVNYTKGAAAFAVDGVTYLWDGGRNGLVRIGDALTADDGTRNGSFVDESGAITWYSYNINDAQTDPNTNKVYYIGTVNDKDGVKIYPSADGRTVTYDNLTSIEKNTSHITEQDIIDKTDKAMTEAKLKKNNVGGIDFNSAFLNLQIKRDNNGVPLSMQFQDVSKINIQGLEPVIINITPVNMEVVPMFSELQTTDDENIQT